MRNSFILFFLLLTKSLQPDAEDALTVKISYSENSKGAIMLNVDIFNNSKRAVVLPVFEMCNDSTYCFNPNMEIIIRKDGNNYYEPWILCHRDINNIKIRKHEKYYFQIPLRFDRLSKEEYFFTYKNYNYGEYNVMLRVELEPNSGTTYDSNVIKIKYNKP